MKKNFLFKTAIIILIIVSLTISLILICKNIFTFNIFENIKQHISKQTENNASENITVIDVTNLEGNAIIEHEHTFKTMYDENNHWEECITCEQKQNIISHSYNKTWSNGVESCQKDRHYTNSCNCGYSYIGHKPCTWNPEIYGTTVYMHVRRCSVCNDEIYHQYYDNKKNLHSALYTSNAFSSNPAFQYCTLKDGTQINCKNGGTCSVCKKVWSPNQHSLTVNSSTGEIYCRYCSTTYGTFSQIIERNKLAPGTYTITNSYNLKNGAELNIDSTKKNGYFRNIPGVLSENNLAIPGTSSKVFDIVCKATFNKSWKNPYQAYTRIIVNINNIECYLDSLPFYIYPDVQSPTIEEITTTNSELLTEWSKTKPITITGTENWTNTVKVKILDDTEKVIFEGETVVTNNSYSISCTPDVECDTNGRTFKLIVTDACNNSTEQKFIISKIDNIPPKPISDTLVNESWTKSKNFTFKAIDNGIGNVQIAFHNIKDLQLSTLNENNEYIRNYKFIGDVYTPKELPVLYQDGLRNTSIQKIIIDKIDNTAPTITDVNIHNNIITIESNDEHPLLGNGSGVVKYRYITSTEKLENPTISETNSIEISINDTLTINNIYQIKYIYIIAEDLVGNISDIYEFKIPELVLTSNVNLDNEKGSIILDWSDYDITDKYFVIYRKKEMLSNWEIILELNQKFNGNSFTDTFANDETPPNVPNINIEKNIENNNIKIISTSNDNGTHYSYYIEAYDKNNISELLAISNQI